jgi:hypothetical protein
MNKIDCDDCINKGQSAGYSDCWHCKKTGKISWDCKPDEKCFESIKKMQTRKNLIREILEINADRVRKYQRDVLIISPSNLFEGFKTAFISKFGHYGSLNLDICLNGKNHLQLISGTIAGTALVHFDTVVMINKEDMDPRFVSEIVAIPANVNDKIPTMEHITIYV